MQKNKYTNYFKNHYKYAISKKDIDRYKQWFVPFWKIIAKYIHISPHTEILELGSGIGGFYPFIARHLQKGHYTGLELDKEAVQFTNTYFGTKAFQNLSLEEYSTKKRYDYIFAFEVLEHVHDPESIIKKIHTLLKPGGLFIGTSPFPFQRNIFADETHLYVLHPDNWKRLFSYNGFSSIIIFPMSFIPVIWKINTVFHIRIPIYINLPFFISTSLIIAKKPMEYD